jgi:Sterol-sensing domain of SREBP cleavage-activation
LLQLIDLEQYNPSLSKGEQWSALAAFLYLPYLGFIIYVAWSVRKMNAVHSRLGVTFTALVEIAVSTITSLSVCALVGFKVTLVPWYFLFCLQMQYSDREVKGVTSHCYRFCWSRKHVQFGNVSVSVIIASNHKSVSG